MDIYTVSLFGHRELVRAIEVEEQLEQLITDLIRTREYVEFLIGRNGEFDLLASSVIRKVIKRFDYGNARLILVLPYMNAEYRDNMDNYHEYYDEVEICTESSSAHYKSAIQVRNRHMVDRSDMVICCIQHESGGAYKTVRYANKNNKKVINIQSYNWFKTFNLGNYI